MIINVGYRGKIEGGNIVFDLNNQSRYDSNINSLEGEEVVITLKKYRKKRTDQQNRYFYGVVVKVIAEELGYSPKEMAKIIKGQFLVTRGDDGFPRVWSTTELNTKRFEEFLEAVRRHYSSEFGIYVPLPNEIEMPEDEFNF